MNHDHLPICVCDCDHQDIKCAMRVRTLSIVRRNNEINDGQRSVEIVTGIVLLVSRTATPIYITYCTPLGVPVPAMYSHACTLTMNTY